VLVLWHVINAQAGMTRWEVLFKLHFMIAVFRLLVASTVMLLFWNVSIPAQQLETLNASYASVTGSRIPLWIAKDAGLFEKYGLNVNLVVIAAGTAAIGALASGNPRAAETMVVDPGAPRISTSPPARAPIAAVPAAITTRLTFSPYFSNKPASLAIHKGIRLPVTEA